MSCPVFSRYTQGVQHLCSAQDKVLYEDLALSIESIGARESRIRSISAAATRLRAFYLARVLCMVHCPDAIRSIYTQLDMDPEAAEALIALGTAGAQSWTGLTEAMARLESVKDEVGLELANVRMMRQGRANPLLERSLVDTKEVLGKAHKALGVLREDLGKEDSGERYGYFVTLVEEVEQLLSVPLSERVSYLDDLSRITATSTIVPRLKQDPVMFASLRS